MSYQFIIAAVDETGAGLHVAAIALDLAQRAHARLGLLTSIPTAAPVPARSTAARTVLAGIQQSLVRETGAEVEATCCVVRGVPGIEVPRHAEDHGADLIVVGHTPRTQSVRLLVGDTADSVTRRSRVPCLLIPPGQDIEGPLVAALDGGRHSAAVLEAACQLSLTIGQPVRVVTVESGRPDEPTPVTPVIPLARSMRLEDEVAEVSGRLGVTASLEVRRGDVVEEILAACSEHSARVLAIGFHRGGPAGVMDGGSIGRRLVHGSSGAVLTVPI